MKSQIMTKKLLPKLSTSIIAISLFVLVACNETTATAEQAPTEVKENIQKVTQTAKPIVTKSVNQSADKTEDKIVVADASHASQTNPTPAPEKKSAPAFVEGVHYFEIFPQINTDAPAGKVEVIELMWIGCPHCYHLEPLVEKYRKNKADYVDFKQVPAMLNPVWSKDAETYYIAQLLDPKGEKKLLSKVLHAIHEQGRRLKNEGAVKRYFAQLGVSEAQYNATKNSMAYKAKLNRARQIGVASQISSVPSFIINGKYRTSPYAAGSEEKLFQLVDMLTKQEKK
ncbi:MAG TPA: thiol:disulfide interchange protein DsbA/DsbL [Leucothrix mucor]|uniref:Thiol:disulfide interchange protein DsbA n=1 Tax=Leucothrix mucor TaxID=45248 RepID=A0A7V2SXW2_LEUMU|nr:thiol:disulfide interchange protein DsbA/DsbL [Leucothrix mucor]